MKKILVIEDEKINIKLYECILKDYFLHIAENGIEGLYFFLKNDYDVVIVDLMMPYMNGYDVLKYIKTIPKKCKIIVCTAVQNNELHTVWFDDILIKPILKKDLIRVIEGDDFDAKI